MDLKKLLPFENYTLTTRLTPQEVCQRISDNTGPQRTFASFFERSNPISKPYEGFVGRNIFKIKRVISYRNSFMPVISGYVYTEREKTHVKIEMKIIQWALIFVSVALVLIIAGTFFMNTVFSSTQPDTIFNNFIFSSFRLVLPLVFILVILISFKIESRIAKRFLAKLLEVEKE